VCAPSPVAASPHSAERKADTPVRRERILTHKPRRLLLAPWRSVCACGLGAWPCPALRMLERQAAWRRPNSGPAWAAPTRPHPRVAPLLTPGQAARCRRPGR
jgi:hypothetical protein